MAALTSADITITVTERWQEGRKRHAIGTLAIAGTNTYPTAGIPMPAIGKFGMQRQLDVLDVTGSAGNTTEFMYGYDKTNNKLQLYSEEVVAAGGPLLEALSSEVPGARTVRFHAVGF